MNRIAMIKAALIAALAMGVGAASAQQAGLQSYDVELVIFRNLAGGATPEDWGKETGIVSQGALPADEDGSDAVAVESTPVATATDVFPALPAGKLKLGGIADTLRRSRNFQPVAHFGWTQPGFPRTEAHYMSIDAQAAAGSGLSGRVALSRGRYLHLTLDLTLAPPGSNDQYVLRQTRRMRSNERHYIDHPKFGVIALVTPSGSAEQ